MPQFLQFLIPLIIIGLVIPAIADIWVNPYFTIVILPIMDVMISLVMSFTIGLGFAFFTSPNLKQIANELKTIEVVILPFLLIYISIFLMMIHTGQVVSILKVFISVIWVIFLMLGVIMVAVTGVPGGAIMAAFGFLSSMLGFGEPALMIALYIAMDNFGTACNVTRNGAIAVVMDKFFYKK